MSYELLRREINDSHVRGLYLFFGQEEYLIAHYLREIEKIIIEPQAKDVSYNLFEGRADPGAVHNACSSYPLAGARRLIVLKNCGVFKTPAGKGKNDGFAPIIEKLPDFICLVIVESEVDKRNALFKQIGASGLIVEFRLRTSAELENWARAIAGREGRQFTRDALRQFIEYSGDTMTEIKSELDKLLMFTYEKPGITAEDVAGLLNVSIKAGIFDLLDNIVYGRRKQALAGLESLLREREPPMRIFAALTGHLVLLRQIKGFADGGARLSEATGILSINPYRAEKLWRQCSGATSDAITRALEQCYEKDKEIKGGKIDDASAIRLLAASLSVRRRDGE